ncbi:MAG: hypothetical protein HYY42_01945 [Chloroflexi bacterium]|nr:hypothetical protein [Chloroflexota bacterium]
MRDYARALADPSGGPALAASDELAALMRAHDDRAFAVTYERELPLVVEREAAIAIRRPARRRGGGGRAGRA